MRAVSRRFIEAWIVLTVVGLAIALPVWAGNQGERVLPVICVTIGLSLIAAVLVVAFKRWARPERWFIYQRLGITASEYHDIIYLARHGKLPAGFSTQTVLTILEHDLKSNRFTPRILILLCVAFIVLAWISIMVTHELPVGLGFILFFNGIRFVDFHFRVLPKYTVLIGTLKQRL